MAQGIADVLGSDHAPHTLEEKAKPYPASPSGMTGVQTLVPIMLDHVAPGRLSIERFVDLTSAGPARIFGIARKGRIAVGYDADLTVVDLKRRETITNAWIASHAGWTPYDGKTVTGWPVGTVVRGLPVMWEGELTGPAAGQAVRFLEALELTLSPRTGCDDSRAGFSTSSRRKRVMINCTEAHADPVGLGRIPGSRDCRSRRAAPCAGWMEIPSASMSRVMRPRHSSSSLLPQSGHRKASAPMIFRQPQQLRLVRRRRRFGLLDLLGGLAGLRRRAWAQLARAAGWTGCTATGGGGGGSAGFPRPAELGLRTLRRRGDDHCGQRQDNPSGETSACSSPLVRQ